MVLIFHFGSSGWIRVDFQFYFDGFWPPVKFLVVKLQEFPDGILLEKNALDRAFEVLSFDNLDVVSEGFEFTFKVVLVTVERESLYDI